LQKGRQLPGKGVALWFVVFLPGCSQTGKALDLVRAPNDLVEASVAGQGRDWVLRQATRTITIDDVEERILPASPPSRLRYHLDIPQKARLCFGYAIDPGKHDHPGVEFVVRVHTKDRDETVWTSLLDPIAHPDHRRWMSASVDLAAFAGRDRDLILETRGYEPGDLRRAYWGAPALTLRDSKAPLVVLYLTDTLRADHTGPYGYKRDTTPFLNVFARDSVVFEKAIAQASWTKPSTASIMTSLLPGQHRVVQLRDPLDSSFTTLAEMLEAKGFVTGAAIANSVIYLPGNGFNQGFGFFAGIHDANGQPSKDAKAGDTVDAALAWLRGREGLPTFLYVHTMDPHVPYSPPAPFDQRYEPHPIPGHPAVDPRTDYLEPLDRDRLMAQYDGDVAYNDQEFGRFIADLKARGLYDGALIVFVADHGEEFLEHGQWLHGRSVFDELVHIPLIIKFPGQQGAGRRIAQQVQEVDVLPTILESQHLPVPVPPAIAGRPLQAVLDGKLAERPAISEISHRGIVALGIRNSREKYIERYAPDEDELYFDLQKDPLEKRNLLEEAPERARLLKASLEQAMTRNPFRHNLKFEGAGDYLVRLKTRGWIEHVEPSGLGPEDRSELDANGRKLTLRIRPKPGQPREVAFSLRPIGVPVILEGTCDGRLLRKEDIFIAQEGVHPKKLPYQLPEIETEHERAENIFAPPRAAGPGIHLWLTLLKGRTLLSMDKASCEKFRALGYVASCAPY